MTTPFVEVKPMTRWQQIMWRMKFALARLSRRFPRLVWPGDEVEVVVTWTKHGFKAPAEGFRSIEEAGEFALHEMTIGSNVYELEEAFHERGVRFDTGVSEDGRHWEWDWSLKGPLKVEFRRRRAKA